MDILIRKGKLKYVPPNALQEVISIKQEQNITGDADAFKEMAKYSRLGRELEMMKKKFFLQDLNRRKK